MREIKFRAWHKNALCMEEVNNIKWWSGQISEVGIRLGVMRSSPMREDFVLMQYTGLKDKNGKEIYEGDIVRHIVKNLDGKNFESFRSEIKWWPNMVDVSKAVIIGNIYENPKLLK